MPCAIALRADFDAPILRRLARRSKEAAQARRLLALAAIYDGGRPTEAARFGNVTLQIERDWMMRFNAEGPDGLHDRKAPGPTPRLTDAHRHALAVQIASIPEKIRGFGPVKERHLEKAKAEEAKLLARFRAALAPHKVAAE